MATKSTARKTSKTTSKTKASTAARSTAGDKVGKLESQVKNLEARVKDLEEHQIKLSVDYNETKGKLIKWVTANPLGALGVAIVIGLIIGLIFS